MALDGRLDDTTYDLVFGRKANTWQMALDDTIYELAKDEKLTFGKWH